MFDGILLKKQEPYSQSQVQVTATRIEDLYKPSGCPTDRQYSRQRLCIEYSDGV